MNAYELADKLDKSKAWLESLNTQYKNGFGKYCLLPEEVAKMLRQQADRIAQLESQAEPIALAKYYPELDMWALAAKNIPPHPSEGFIPVYTSPQKEIA